MKQTLPCALRIAALSLLTVPGLHAAPKSVPDPKDEITPVVTSSAESTPPPSQEFLMEGSITGKSDVKQGNAQYGGVSNINSHLNYVISPQIKEGLLMRVGVDYNRNSFGLYDNAVLPNTLQSTNLIIGADMAIGDRIIMRVEAHPGLYSVFVSITGSDFDMPVQIGGTYLYSKDLQFIFGIQIDLKSNLPLIGLPGVRWQFAKDWVLSAIPPKPQLQYLVNRSLTLYVGADLLGGTYHLNNNFGNDHGNTQMNGNIVDFAEVRVGGGVTWKVTPNLSLDVSGGYVPYRSFEIHADQIGYGTFKTKTQSQFSDGAPYAQVGLSGSF